MGIHIRVTKENIGLVEQETFTRINRTIDSIEEALDYWDSLKKKPQHLRMKMLKYYGMKTALTKWVNDFMKRSDEESYSNRLKRLQDFVDICQVYR